MSIRILVTYATKHGATAEIAEKIGGVLRQDGFEVDVRPVERVSDASPYDAVVLGSAVYIGRWRREAAAFLKQHEEILAERAVWIFSSGPTGREDPVAAMDGWRFPEKLRPIVERIEPRDVVVFHGILDPERLNFIERAMIDKVGAPVGDFRDWDAIASWARGIAATLRDRFEPVPCA